MKLAEIEEGRKEGRKEEGKWDEKLVQSTERKQQQQQQQKEKGSSLFRGLAGKLDHEAREFWARIESSDKGSNVLVA